MLRLIFGLTLLLLATAHPAAAQSNDALMGLGHHEQGKYGEAIQSYEAEIAKGQVNGHLFYNLGHAYYRNGQKGQAMAAFLAAKRFLPRNPDVKANLQHVHKNIDDNLAYSKDLGVMGAVGFWLSGITVSNAPPRPKAITGRPIACASKRVIPKSSSPQKHYTYRALFV